MYSMFFFYKNEGYITMKSCQAATNQKSVCKKLSTNNVNLKHRTQIKILQMYHTEWITQLSRKYVQFIDRTCNLALECYSFFKLIK